LGRIIKIRCESGNVPDVRLARTSTIGDEHFDSTTAIEMPLLFIIVEYGKRGRVDAEEQETFHTGITLRGDVRIALLRNDPFEPE
jgi:hypothetical protein